MSVRNRNVAVVVHRSDDFSTRTYDQLCEGVLDSPEDAIQLVDGKSIAIDTDDRRVAAPADRIVDALSAWSWLETASE